MAVVWGLFEGAAALYLKLVPFRGVEHQRSTELLPLEGRAELHELLKRELGDFYKPASVQRHRYILDGRTVFDVNYTIDEHSRRVTPGREVEHREYILFFGGSFSFGMGVLDHQTLASRVGAMMEGFRTYNYGMFGAGPNMTLSRLRNVIERREVAEPDGLLVYVLTADDFQRVVGSMSYLRWNGGWGPYYHLNEERELVRSGSFRTGRPVTTGLYGLLGRSFVLAAIGLDLPLSSWGESHVELTAKVIHESSLAYQRKFGSRRFVVLFFPGTARAAPRLKPYFERLNVRYLDYAGLFDGLNRSDLEFPRNGHPTARAYRLVAERLAGDLPKLSW